MICAIFAVDENEGFGNKGTLPWKRIKEDMQWFSEKTSGNIVVMGHNTWNAPDMNSPLPNRENYVFGSCDHLDGATVLSGSPIEEIQKLSDNNTKDVFVIGGKRLLEGCAGIYDRVFITKVQGYHTADVLLDVSAIVTGLRLTGSRRLSKNAILEIYE